MGGILGYWVWHHGIIESHSVAAENKIFNDGAAAKFSRGVDVSKILGSKKRLFLTPEMRGVDPFSVFFGGKTGRRPFFGGKTGRRPFFGGKKVRLPVFRQKSRKFHFYGGLARVQGRSNDSDPRPREQGRSALDGKAPLPVFYSCPCPKAIRKTRWT